jgi:hypothetical protein
VSPKHDSGVKPHAGFPSFINLVERWKILPQNVFFDGMVKFPARDYRMGFQQYRQTAPG